MYHVVLKETKMHSYLCLTMTFQNKTSGSTGCLLKKKNKLTQKMATINTICNDRQLLNTTCNAR